MILWLIASAALIYTAICVVVYFYQEKMMFFPEKLPQSFHFNFSTPFVELDYLTSDETTINALLFKVDNTKGIVFYSHGNAGSLQGWGSVAEQFTMLGFDCLVYDYRCFGKSTGKLSEDGIFQDAQYIYQKLAEEYGEDKIIVYGRSMGSGVATYVASQNDPAMLILETPFYSGKDLAHKWYPWLPTFLLRYNFRTDQYLPKVKCPIYLIHGTDDEVVYYGSSLKLEKLLKAGDKFFTIDGGHHNDLSHFLEFQEGLKQILHK